MPDTPVTEPVVVSPTQSPTQVAPATAPAATEPAGQADPLTGMTPEQVDALAARIAERQANRPASLAEQFAQLKDELTGQHRTKEEAVETKKAAAAAADQAAEMISTIHETLRRTELTEAATAANFKNPAVVAAALVGRDGDIATLIAEAVNTGAYAMTTPAPSAQLGGQSSSTASDVDPGIAALIAEVAEATGRK